MSGPSRGALGGVSLPAVATIRPSGAFGVAAHEESAMSFLQKARDAATQAAEQARHGVERVTDAEHQAKYSEQLSLAGHKAKDAASVPKKGIATAIERIDPGILADLVIKATALQEKTNISLRDKKSPYRITEIAISASIPPGVQFSIGRVEDPNRPVTAELDSTEIVQSGALGAIEGETIVSLSGEVVAEDDDDEPEAIQPGP
jgi:hypothetical protein